MPDRRSTPALRELQAELFALISDRRGVERGMRDRGLSSAAIRRMVRGDRRRGAVARLAVYNRMYFLRLLEVLRGDYPKLLAVIGDAAFGKLVAGYLDAFPSRDPSVRHVGRSLPEFLGAQAFGRRRPWLAEVARLEWARVEVRDRVDEDLLSESQLQELPADRLGKLPLRLVTAHERIATSHAVADVWRRVEQGEPPGRPKRQAACLLVWRQHMAVYHRPMAADEAALLPRLVGGVPFGLICGELGRNTPAEQAARRAAELLTTWTSSGLLVRPDLRHEPAGRA